MSGYPAVFAAIYNPILLTGELAGMRKLRAEVVGQATGVVLEIGAGTGLNLPHYTDRALAITLTEPDGPMFARLQKKAASVGRKVELAQAPAERLPVDDASIDTVLSTMVLCTAGDIRATLLEIRRVLKPGGTLQLVEHVRAAGRLGAAQDKLHGPWKAFACGCNCNLDTPALLDAAGFEFALRDGTWGLMPPLVRPLVVGSAWPA